MARHYEAAQENSLIKIVHNSQTKTVLYLRTLFMSDMIKKIIGAIF